jgi:hypothetical protein
VFTQLLFSRKHRTTKTSLRPEAGEEERIGEDAVLSHHEDHAEAGVGKNKILEIP